MDGEDEALEAWERRLRIAEDELTEREQRALADDPAPGALAAFAAERDKIAVDRDSIAERHDERAAARDRSALVRDLAGSHRDRQSRSPQQDLDVAFPDRVAAGEDRDLAAGDRSDSHDDRARARESREQAAGNRGRAAQDRDRALRRADEQDEQLRGIRTAFDSRLVIGQAQGLLMARHSLSSEAAFTVLVRLSQAENRKLRDVAARMVHDAEPPGQS